MVNWVSNSLDDASKTAVLPTLERAQSVLQRLTLANPTNLVLQGDMAWVEGQLGKRLATAGRMMEAVAHYRQSLAQLESLAEPTSAGLYDMARCRALIAGAASAPGSGLTLEIGQAEAERAVADLRRAVMAGYANVPWLRTGDPDLNPIRPRDDFQVLIMDIDFPKNPLEKGDEWVVKP